MPQVKPKDSKEAENKQPKLTPEENFEKTISNINRLLIKNARPVQVQLLKNAGDSHFYQFADNTDQAKETREAVREQLQSLWQSGAYNYQDLADALRLNTLDIQGLLDDEFRRKKNLE